MKRITDEDVIAALTPAELVERLTACHLTIDSMAYVLGISPATLERRLAQESEWSAAHARGRAAERNDLRVSMFAAIHKGAAAPLIFAAKQPESKGGLDWKDSHEITLKDLRGVLAQLGALSDDDLARLAGEDLASMNDDGGEH